MKNTVGQMNPSVCANEKISVKALMDKMGITKKEYLEISDKYGVHASRLIEIMEMSKYQFVHKSHVSSRGAGVV